MHFISLLGVEFQKIRRSKILLLLLLPLVVLWIPSIINAEMNFHMTAEGISPENNFFIQSFMGMTWFMFPASIVVCTVLLNQTERTNRGILKMLSMPLNKTKLCMAKFTVLVVLAAVQMVMMIGLYFVCAQIASKTQNYSFLLPVRFLFSETGKIFAASIPMIACYWMLSVCIKTPVFAVGIGLAVIVPSVLIINTKAWFLYPMCYPFYVIVSEYGKLASEINTQELQLIPWIPIALGMTAIFLTVSCSCFGKGEER